MSLLSDCSPSIRHWAKARLITRGDKRMGCLGAASDNDTTHIICWRAEQ